MKLIVIFAIILIILLPLTASATSPEIYIPTSTRNPVITFPFPVARDVPIGVTSANVNVIWERRVRQARCNISVISTDFIIDLHLQYFGEDPNIVEIALPIIPPPTMPMQPRIEPTFYLDGTPAQLFGYPFAENLRINSKSSGFRNLAGHGTFLFSSAHNRDDATGSWNYVEEMRVLVERHTHPFITQNFDADAPARLYTLVPEFTDDSNFQIRFNLSYDPAQTILLTDRIGGFRLERSEDGNIIARHVSHDHRNHHPLEVLVIGSDTLTWYADSSFAPLSDSVSLSGTFIYETPRSFIERKQKDLQDSALPIILDDFLLRRVDDVVVKPLLSPPQNWRAPGFVNMSSVWPRTRPAAVTAIPFEPGEERVLQISFSAYAAFEWDEELQQSLFHHAILTELIAHWDFFNELTVRVTPPSDVRGYAFSDGFNVLNNRSVLNVSPSPEENILFGFWLDDIREPRRTDSFSPFEMLPSLENRNTWYSNLLILAGSGLTVVIILVCIIIALCKKTKDQR